MEEATKYEKFYEFFKGNNYYLVLAAVILIPIGTNALAYKKPMNTLYYLNILIALILFIYAGYVLNEYRSIYNLANDIGKFFNLFELSEEEIKKQMEDYKTTVKSEIGNRCIFISVISIILGLFSLVWNVKQLLNQSK